MNTSDVRLVWKHGYSAGWLAAQQELAQAAAAEQEALPEARPAGESQPAEAPK